MKVLAFLPLAYLAGIELFPFFALYVALFMAVVIVMKRVQNARQRRVSPITVPIAPILPTSRT